MRVIFPLGLTALLLAACVQPKGFFPISRGGDHALFVEPVQNWRDANGGCIEGGECWSDRSREDIRNRLSIVQAETRLYEQQENGRLSYLGSSASIGRGKYRLEKYVIAFTNKPCRPEDPGAGLQRVGVGVRVTADIVSRTRNLELDGLLTAAVAASQNELRGEMAIRSWGVNSTNRTLSSLISRANVSLNEDGVQKALSALTVGEVLLEDPDTVLSPWTFAIVEAEPGSCRPGFAPGG